LANTSIKSKGRRGSETYPQYAVCISNDGNEASLDLGRIYQVVRPGTGDPSSMLRVIDNEGEDYLYSRSQFVPVELPARAKKAIAAAISAA
jgi:hypothetical protein